MAELKTGVGRMVFGHPMKAVARKDKENKPILRDGQPVMQWVFGIAFPKAMFNSEIWPVLAAEAATGFPNGVPQGFSWKFRDGDGVDRNGKPYNLREGYAGCYVLTVSTEAFQPPVFRFANGGYVQMAANELKTGDYFALALNAKCNVPKDKTHTPGLYINPVAIEFVGYGSEIITTADPMALFGGRQHQLPPGASLTPIAAQTSVGMPGTGGFAPSAPGMPGMAYPSQGAPSAGGYAPPPAHDFVHGPGAGMPGAPAMAYPSQGAQSAGGGAGNAAYPGIMPGMMQQAPAGQTAPTNAYPSNGMPPMPGMMPPR